jgi:hypothetical protein
MRAPFSLRLLFQDYGLVTEPDALVALVQCFRAADRESELELRRAGSPRFHAKAYGFRSDRSCQVIFGSANLSRKAISGAGSGELMGQLTGRVARDAWTILANFWDRGIDISDDWLAQYRRAKEELTQASRLANLVVRRWRPYDRHRRTTQMTKRKSAGSLSRVPPFKAFLKWLRQHRSIAGADYILTLAGDRLRQRRQGHVKQTFAGVYRFLQEYQGAATMLRAVPADKKGIVTPPRQLLRSWNQHLRDHASWKHNSFSYPTLRRIIPRRLGGTLGRGGGGASGELKRAFHLVPLFMETE